MHVVFYTFDGVKDYVLCFPNLVLKKMVNPAFNFGSEDRIIIFGMPGHMEVDFAIDILGHVRSLEVVEVEISE